MSYITNGENESLDSSTTGTIIEFDKFKDDMTHFLQNVTPGTESIRCNALISEWNRVMGTKYTPKETYGEEVTLKNLVQKYPDQFSFEGKGHDRIIHLGKPKPTPKSCKRDISMEEVADFMTSLRFSEMKVLVECFKKKEVDPELLIVMGENMLKKS